MKLCSLEALPNQEYQVIALVKGSVVESKHIGSDFMAGLKNIVGGEINEYTEMLNDARETATKRMIGEAEKLGADAIIGIRYTTSSIMQSASEILVYGTAIKFL